MLIVGEKEAGRTSCCQKTREGDKGSMKFEDFGKIFNEEVQNMINMW